MSHVSGYHSVLSELSRRLAEPAPGRVQVLTGPRQVGKTHLLLELTRAMGDGAVYLAADAPEAALPGWWEANWRSALRAARDRHMVLLVDEVQYLPGFERTIKAAFDEAARTQARVHIVVTGSAALGVGARVRETMAGRSERLEIRQWTPRDLASAFGLNEADAVSAYVRFGGFPGAIGLLSDVPRWRAYVRDSIIDPAIGRDLLLLEQVRKPALLRQVFALAVAHPSEIVSLSKLASSLSEAGALETIAHYLELLGRAYLVSALGKWTKNELRRRAAPPKLVPMSNAFLAAGRSTEPPDPSSDPSAWGRWVETACIALAIGAGQTVRYWREEPFEVDATLEGSWGQWAVEIKTGHYGARDLGGLLEFTRRNPAYRPVVLCDAGLEDAARACGVEVVPWRQFLWDGLSDADGVSVPS